MRGLIAFIMLMGWISTADAQRVATIIANSDYKQNNLDLRNPVRDAHLIKRALQDVDFDVQIIINANQDEMEKAISRHGRRLSAAGKNAVGFFYYAGHGIQSQGLNYLIPTDIVVRTEADIWADAPRLELLFQNVSAAGNATNFIVLDACRDTPIPRSYRNASAGLARASGKLRGTMIVYSTAPGTQANDAPSLPNSPFATSLARHLPSAGITAERMFKRVGTDTERISFQLDKEFRQEPWVEGNLRGADFCFGGCAGAAPGSFETVESETAALNDAYASNDPYTLRAFLNNFPRTTSRGLIESRISELEGTDTTPASRAVVADVASTPVRVQPNVSVRLARVTASRSDIRDRPSNDAASIRALTYGQYVSVTGSAAAGWVQVKFRLTEGFMPMWQLEIE